MSYNETFDNLPFNGKCKNLIDKFLIIGYDKITFKNILNNFISKENDLNENKKKDDSKIFNDIFFNFNQSMNLRNSLKINSSRDKRNYKNNVYYIKKSIDESPLILNEFMYDFNKNIIDNEKIIEITFPNKYYIFYNVEENNLDKNIKINKAKTLKNNDSFIEFENKPYSQNIIFSISPESDSNSKKNQNGISHIFYQSYIKKEKNKLFHIYFPIVFTIISEYPFWSKYITIFNLIKDLYLNQKEKYLEIHQIIYNLVTFTPSPLNSNIKINLNSIYKSIDYDILSFPMIDSFPIIDYNLGKIILSISTLNLITLFIITFLEKDIIFFSTNLEELNLYIYTFLILNFPLNDSQYYWYCVSVSKDSYFKRESPFVEKVFSSILGINNEFNIKNYSNKSNELYFYDIENDVLKINDSNKDNINIISTVKYLIKKESNYNIKAFYDKIENLKKTFLLNNLNEEFFKISEYEKKNNENIQNLFFELNLFLCSFFLNNIKININTNKNFVIEYDKNILIDKKKNKYIVSFNKNFQESIKFQSFVNNYIQNFSSLDFYKIPFFVFENLYFFKNKKKHDLDININDLFHFIYKKILNQNLLSSNVLEKFENFMIYKENNIDFTNYFNNQSSLYKNYEKNIIENDNDDEFENIFIYELNNNDLFIYIYKLQELDKNKLLKLFPFINNLENNVIYKIDYIFLEKQLELYFINKNCFTQENKMANCIISLYCLLFSRFSPDCLNLYFSFIESLFCNNKIYILRYYYYLILHILNKNYEYSKNTETKNYILDMIYKIINEILIKQNIFPNALIFQFIKKFEKELINREISIINKEDFFKSFSVKIINKQNDGQQMNIEILKTIKLENQNNIKIIVKFDENRYESDYLNINQIYNLILQEQNILLVQNLHNKIDNNLINNIIISLISNLHIYEKDIFSSDDVNSYIQILGEFLRLIN